MNLDNVNPLKTRNAYKKAADAALTALLDKHPKPTRGQLASTALDKHSASFRRNVRIALWAMVVIAGFLSFLKQYISSDSVLTPLLIGWSEAAKFIPILFCWSFGELGSILFSVAAGTIARNRFTKIVFRTASFLCAFLAIVANFSATQLHSEGIPTSYSVYLWVLTVLPPGMVLALANILEHFQREDREKAVDAERKYEAALARYNDWKAAILKSSEYRASLGNELIIALRSANINNDDAISALDIQYGDVALEALRLREIRKWDRSILSDSEIAPAPQDATSADRPTTPAQAGQSDTDSPTVTRHL